MKNKTLKYIVSGTKAFKFSVLNLGIKKNKNHKIVSQKDRVYTVEIDNKKFTGISTQKKQNKYSVELNGNFYHFSIEQELTQKRVKVLKNSSATQKYHTLKSPMPGKITAILVSKGTAVKKGEPLLILEAMKMQNQVLASSDSIVQEIKIKEEQTVLNDQELILLETK